jgi:xanthine dehydrogenase accessory factor
MIEEIEQSVRKGIDLVLVTIVSDSGSTPRTSGSKMIVYGDGQIVGTIGGGPVEGDAIDRALTLFTTQGCDIVSYNLNQNDNLAKMDLICGGRMQVLMEYISADNQGIELFQTICEQSRLSRSCILVRQLKETADHLRVDRAVVTAENSWIGTFNLPADQLQMLEKGGSNAMTSWAEIGEGRYVVEWFLPPETIYLVGGGHVSKEIATLTKMVGFRTVVMDDRAEFANTNRFKDVDGVKVCPGYTDIFADFEITANSYIVILTRGHSFDKEALGQALQTDAGYIGMIGSRRKRQSIYGQLLKEGFEQSLLDQVNCPIGLPIGAETPAEIGISVVAQLIQHRAGRKTSGQ